MQVTSDGQWLGGIPRDPPDATLYNRLLLASQHPSTADQKERPHEALHNLTRFGLVASSFGGAPAGAHYIVDHLLNSAQNDGNTRPSPFTLHYAPNATVQIPARSHLNLLHISQSLPCNIFMFSSKSKPITYLHNDSVQTIGLFHVYDSFLGISQFVVLTTSTHIESLRIPGDRAPTGGEQSLIPAAKLRRDSIRKRKTPGTRVLDQATACESSRDAFREACILIMADQIQQKGVAPTMKAKLEPDQSRASLLESKRETVRSKFNAAKRVPRGTLEKAFETFKNAHHLTRDYTMRMFGRDLAFEDNVSEWRKVVHDEFDGVWAVECNKAIGVQSGTTVDTGPGAVGKPGSASGLLDQDKAPATADSNHEPKEGAQEQAVVNLDESVEFDEGGPVTQVQASETISTSGQGNDDSQEELRTCATTLKHVLREELIPEYDLITSRLDDCQQTMTEITAEMAIVAQKAAILIAEGELNEVMGFPKPVSAEFNIKIVLPANFPFQADVNTVVNAAPIPVGLQERLENGSKTAITRTHHDLIRLFLPDCMRYFYTAFLGPQGTQRNDGNHPLWDCLIAAIDSSSDAPALSSSPTGIACTITEHMTQLSTALTNMWERSIYDKSLDYALRILLRLHLAPNRELKNKEQAKAAVLKKKARAAKPKKTSHGLWLLKLRLMCDEVADSLSKTSPNENRLAAIRSRLLVLQQEEPIPIIKDLPPLEEQLRELEARVTDQSPADCNEDTGLACNAILAVDDLDHLLGEAEDDDDEEDDNDDESGVKEGETATIGEAGHGQKEPSRQRLRSLQAILKMLLESPSIQEKINCKWVRESGFAKEDFTDRECEVVAHLANMLRPYVPKVKQDDQGRTIKPPAHVAMRASFVSIANSVVRAAGYPEFARRISPQVSAGSTQALHLGSVGLYETFCSAGDFEVMDPEGRPLTSRASVTQPPTNKKVVTGAFLDIKAVDALCSSHGLLFKDRITYVDPYTVHLTGSVIKEDRHPVNSRYERRKKATKGQHRNYWLDAFRESGLTKAEVFEKASALADDVKSQEKVVRSKRKKVSSSLQVQTALKDALKLLNSDTTRSELKEAQQSLRQHREELEPLEEALRLLRSERYKYNKMHKAAVDSGSDLDSTKNEGHPASRSSSSKETIPTWELPACEDRADKTDIRDLIRNARGTNRLVTVAGTDYGLVTMAETVPLTLAQVETHINRFEMLQNDPDAMVDEVLSDMQLPRAIRTTAAQIDCVSRTRYIAKRREGRLRQNQEVQDAMATITAPESTLSLATTLPAVDRAHQHRKGVAGVLRKFERTKSRLRDLHTKQLRTERAWKRLCAHERQQVQQHALPAPLESSTMSPDDGWCQGCSAHHVPRQFQNGRPFQHLSHCPKIASHVIPVLFIGDAGTCVGSRLKGHSRRGGAKLRSQHRQSCPVLMTDEFRTSKVCLFCTKQMSLARARRIVKGQIKFIRLHGALECCNAKCVSFKRHYSIRPRDTNAAAAIAVVGTAQALGKGRLKAFSRGATNDTTNNASPSALEPLSHTQHLSGCTGCTSGERGL